MAFESQIKPACFKISAFDRIESETISALFVGKSFGLRFHLGKPAADAFFTGPPRHKLGTEAIAPSRAGKGLAKAPHGGAIARQLGCRASRSVDGALLFGSSCMAR